MVHRSQLQVFTRTRVAALVAIGLTALALGYLALPDGSGLTVPDGARAGDLALEPCSFDTEAGSLDAECGTLVVPENRRDPGSDLIALPVVRIRATSGDPAEPIFRFAGGPGGTNMSFPEASRLTDGHDVVLVGYRGVDGSTVLDCPEVESAVQRSADFTGEESMRRYAKAFADCARRLTGEGVDLDGYSLPQRVDDFEAARQALGYQRIHLLSQSAGTRAAMIYAWRYPESIHRSVMIAVNPPGHFWWDPAVTDDQLGHYAALCARDDGCAARTDDLAATMAAVSADLPDRWMFLPIKKGNVRAGTQFGLYHTTEAAAPLNAPTMFDAWLAAASGDPSGFWAISMLTSVVFPGTFVWGEFAASGVIDAEVVDGHYATGGAADSILANAANEFLWAGGRLTDGWPASPDYVDYQQVRPSKVETLLVGGTVDFSTPPQFATDELLPALPNGRQVILAELGHTVDFWSYQPDASTQLLSAYFQRGEVDDSRYETRPAEFEAGTVSLSTIAWVLFGTLACLALVALTLLGGMALRVHRRGRLGSRASAWLRGLAPMVVGIGGWSLAVLVGSSLCPGLFVGGQWLAVVSIGIAAGLATFGAWVDRDRTRRTRSAGLAAALAGSLLGAWLGFHAVAGLAALVTTVVGATITANLALILIDIRRESQSPAVPR
ncbi:alpha/beta hydrolase [Plantactinospora sp. KLBMP9567]|uniref:alpha/beta hydrolase n=1 Tax=Plantactinospora sp. KLBMP9567 TaxID=3085900 RepID=UPI002980F4E0|nr:alpha/beta hydrolase [Plantactinospora sp. KLBMP9567]MDW5329605.1 alpha/beta hydrolase [Plantactinospora sp. KLBMP9567]